MKEFFRKVSRSFILGVINIYCKIVYRYKVEGQENIPSEEPVIFCGNHKSFLDPPLMMITCKRNPRFLAKEELTKNVFMKMLGNLFEVILVSRNAKDVAVLKESLKTLKGGRCLALYPEGTRNGIAKGEKVKDGAAFFTIRSGCKVVPVGMIGGEKPFKKVIIRYGKPLDFSQYTDVKDKESLDIVTDKIMDAILSLTK